ANAPNWGSMYVMLQPFSQRAVPDLQGPAITVRLQELCWREVQGAAVKVFGPPPVDGLGTVSGFQFVIQDRGGLVLEGLQRAADTLVAQGKQTPGLVGLFTNLRSNTPWMYLDIDREKVRSLDVEIQEVFQALQVNLGSYYVNNFNRFGRSWQV